MVARVTQRANNATTIAITNLVGANRRDTSRHYDLIRVSNSRIKEFPALFLFLSHLKRFSLYSTTLNNARSVFSVTERLFGFVQPAPARTAKGRGLAGRSRRKYLVYSAIF